MTEWIMTSSVVITAILVIRFCFKERIGARLRYALWLVVLIRLLLPVQIGESAISAAQLDRELPRISAQIQETLVREWKYRDFEPDLKEALIARDKEEYDPYYTFSEYLAYRADDITAFLRVIWYIGGALTAAVMLIGNISLYRRLRRSRVRLNEPSTNIAIYRTDAAGVPCVFGFPIPAIYLTSAVTDDPAAYRHVLAHERAHIRHGDTLFAFLRCVCLVMHWYNPLVWAAAELSKEDGESACDAAAIRKLGEGERYAYGRTLLSLADPRRTKIVAVKSLLSASADAAAQSERGIAARIKQIAEKKRTAAVLSSCIVLAVLVLTVSGFSGIRSDRTAADLDAPSYVIDAAIAWETAYIKEQNEGLAEARQMIFERTGEMFSYEDYFISDWQIVGLDYIKNIAPVLGRELEIWNVRVREYSDSNRGHVVNHHLYGGSMDGSGWLYREDFYLIFDSNDKTLLKQYRSIEERYVPTEDNIMHGTGLNDDFTRDLLYCMRYYEKYGYHSSDETTLRMVGALSLMTVHDIASGSADDPYHYVDDVCYKVEYVSSSAHHRWGEEQLWRVIVNETGEVCGYAVYYPDHDDIAISDERGRLQ